MIAPAPGAIFLLRSSQNDFGGVVCVRREVSDTQTNYRGFPSKRKNPSIVLSSCPILDFRVGQRQLPIGTARDSSKTLDATRTQANPRLSLRAFRCLSGNSFLVIHRLKLKGHFVGRPVRMFRHFVLMHSRATATKTPACSCGVTSPSPSSCGSKPFPPTPQLPRAPHRVLRPRFLP